jgi:hypothetical protein
MSKDGVTRRTAVALTGAILTSAVLPAGFAQAATTPDQPRLGVFGIIFENVASYYSVSHNEILSDDRSSRIVRARQMGMYLAFMLSGKSLPEIGRRFGGRDATTVLHACRKLERLRQDDATVAIDIGRMLVHSVRAMRERNIPLNAERYAHARWFLKTPPPRGLSPLQAHRYGEAYLERQNAQLARIATFHQKPI